MEGPPEPLKAVHPRGMLAVCFNLLQFRVYVKLLPPRGTPSFRRTPYAPDDLLWRDDDRGPARNLLGWSDYASYGHTTFGGLHTGHGETCVWNLLSRLLSSGRYGEHKAPPLGNNFARENDRIPLWCYALIG